MGHMEEKLLKETLLGTSESKETPLTPSFPPDKLNKLSFLSIMREVLMESSISLGGAMGREDRGRTEICEFTTSQI